MRKIIFFLLISVKCYSQTSIPSSGAITMTQIATVMYNLGEISYAATLVPYSLSYLNSASHLTDKTAPFSISDWYGYGKIPLSDFDYMVIELAWVSAGGEDLDIFVGFQGTGTPYDGDPSSRTNWVGFNQNPIPPALWGIPPANRLIPQGSSTPYLNWGLDNTGTSGKEGVLVDINKFISDYPSTPNPIQYIINACWFQAKGTGDMTVGIVTYKGGTMSISGNSFINTGGVMVNNITENFNVQTLSTSTLIANSTPVAVVSFDKTTNTATLELQ